VPRHLACQGAARKGADEVKCPFHHSMSPIKGLRPWNSRVEGGSAAFYGNFLTTFFVSH
jgi:hypothetical protein